jgi:D-alanyl-D-alanine carboxypeptidase
MKITSNPKHLVLALLFFLCPHVLPAQDYLFFLHNKFVEENGPGDAHPEYGKAEYDEILDYFTRENFVVLSEKRVKNTDARAYARKVAAQIDRLISSGVSAGQITVVGTSKGGYIAQFVSGLMKNKGMNFVFIGSCAEEDVTEMPDIHFYGNILSIYEESDAIARSCQNMRLKSGSTVGRFKEIKLATGLKHGFLFKALPAWLEPSVKWARQDEGIEVPAKSITAGTQTKAGSFSPVEKLDSLLRTPTEKPFNGVVLISKGGITKYARLTGYADMQQKVPFKLDDQFVIGSVSKQFTAVLLLLEYEKGRVKLDAPIRSYLPELPLSWADTVTVDQLLTHMHGIRALDKPLDFAPGTRYAYSQIGYDLVAQIIEKTSGQPFSGLSEALFNKCRMYNTFHPDVQRYHHLVPGYTEDEPGKLVVETETFQNFAAAGSFISTAHDLMLWNRCLHEGKILSPKTYRLMTAKKPGAVRNHPIFGVVHYGYGITVDTNDGILQLGQTGFAPGFISMCFYFPETKTSLIALDNVVRDSQDLQKAFSYHSQMLKLLRESDLVKKTDGYLLNR